MPNIKIFDVGSLPDPLDISIAKGGEKDKHGYSLLEPWVVKGYIDKARSGLDIVNYPQYRDMVSMFLDMFTGLSMVDARYVFLDSPGVSTSRIPEVDILLRHSKEIYDSLGYRSKFKICVTGPYTLSFAFSYRYGELFMELAELLKKITKESIFQNNYLECKMFTLDEPVFGLANDPLIDYGSMGRESLWKAWKAIFEAASRMGVETAIHLHSTSDPLFWEIPSLDVIESHTEDPIYFSKRSRERLEEYDKWLKASICITDYDQLIKNRDSEKMGVDPEYISMVWRRIKSGELDPEYYLEDPDTMAKRLRKIIDVVGDRVKYAGPECGLKGLPSYKSAIEYLKRCVEARDRFEDE
jgi:5-methyltetrahydropteroyltriglutamate--homocysteine methyltransferase